MGDNLDSDLLYEDFQENDDRKEFNVNKFVSKHLKTLRSILESFEFIRGFLSRPVKCFKLGYRSEIK